MNKKAQEYRREVVFENKEVTSGIYELTIRGSFQGNPGQFYMLRAWEEEPLLSRPISIHKIDEDTITFMYAVVGRGTQILSRLKQGDEITLWGPLGNGFQVEGMKGKIALVTGGIGIAPMHEVAKELTGCNVDLYAGFRNTVYGIDEMKPHVENVVISTEDGSVGTKGYIVEAFDPEGYDLVLCCGPEVMMNKVIMMCREKEVPLYVSMESKMACGVGACLVCTCKTRFGNSRTCKDGPVFNGEDIVL